VANTYAIIEIVDFSTVLDKLSTGTMIIRIYGITNPNVPTAKFALITIQLRHMDNLMTTIMEDEYNLALFL